MEDAKIIDLYLKRDQQAVVETDAAYGRQLFTLADRILRSPRDAEESVSDTYYQAWETIPPQKPNYFFAYLAKICRFFALGKLDWNKAAKRNAEVVALTEEMAQCIPDSRLEREMEARELGRILNSFLGSLPKESRMIFVRRYWYVDTIAEIALRYGISESKVKTQLHRTRARLCTYLEQEGIAV